MNQNERPTSYTEGYPDLISDPLSDDVWSVYLQELRRWTKRPI